jgi:hypothetical protein
VAPSQEVEKRVDTTGQRGKGCGSQPGRGGYRACKAAGGSAATSVLARSLLGCCPAWLRRFLRGRCWSLHRCSGCRQGSAMIAGSGGREGQLWQGCRAAASNVLLGSLHRCIHCMQCTAMQRGCAGCNDATKPGRCRGEAAEQASRSVKLSPAPIPVRSDQADPSPCSGRQERELTRGRAKAQPLSLPPGRTG